MKKPRSLAFAFYAIAAAVAVLVLGSADVSAQRNEAQDKPGVPAQGGLLLGYTIFYVKDVKATVAFYERVFGLSRRLLLPDGTYAEMETGHTVLAFSSHKLANSHVPGGFVPSMKDAKPLGVEIDFVTSDVKAAYEKAVAQGASALAAPEVKPWGQTVSYVRDNNGFLIEICSPVPVPSANAAQNAVPDKAEATRPLAINSEAPEVTLTDMQGKSFLLSDALRKQPTVLIFYRGGWCPYCNLHLGQLQAIEGNLKALGYQIIAVSMDKPAELRKTLDKHNLSYTLLSDGDASAVKAFGVAYRMDDKAVAQYRTYGVDLEGSSGQTHHILPVPSVFLIDTNRVIRYVHSDPDYKVRLSPEKLLEAAKANRIGANAGTK